MAKEWHPHDYVPWDEGRDFAFLGGEDWSPGAVAGWTTTAKAAMFVNLLTEDNLPSYHREIATRFGRDGAWGTWVGRWTAEEGRHGIALRDYLVVTRGVDPVELERAADGLHDRRLRLRRQDPAARRSPTSRSRSWPPGSRTATPAGPPADPIAEQLLARIATDENLHMVFYRNLVAAAFDIEPGRDDAGGRATRSIGFEMPGANMADFRKNSMIIAKAGIYDLRLHHDEVVSPVLRTWKVFERTDFGPEGEQAREELAEFLAGLDAQATKFVESRERMRARVAARGEVAVQV